MAMKQTMRKVELPSLLVQQKSTTQNNTSRC